MFPIRNGLKHGDALSPPLFNLALEYAVRRVQDGLKLNGTMAYADHINVLGGSVHTVKENREALVVATKEIGLEVNADKTIYMIMSRDQNTGQRHKVKTNNSSIERVEELKYLATTLTNQYSIQEEIKSRLKLGTACYWSVAESSVFQLVVQGFKDQDIQNYNFTVVLYGCETWSLTLREKRRLRVFKNRVLKRVFGSTRDEVTGKWKKLHNEELRDLYSLRNIVRVVKSRRMRWGACGGNG
jgi:hypothetical protein